jgi:hypothetical protein
VIVEIVDVIVVAVTEDLAQEIVTDAGKLETLVN